MDKAETLEHAKRRATTSYSRMAAGNAGDLAGETVRDEQDVLRARVDLLNELMRSPDTRLCLEAEGRQEGPRVCVTYDRVRCEGELELGPMQSTMAWAVQGCEDTIQQLLSAADKGHEPVIKSLLALVQKSAPRKDVLHGLHRVLSLPPPERMLLKSLATSTGEPHTRVIEGLGEAAALYRVTWGALDLDVLEGWQNPSTNAAIRLSILDAAHQAAREAQRTKAAAWSNVGYIQARIFHGEESHTLTLRPFWDSESCTVSHLQFRQSVFDDFGPERGLLNLAQDPASIHPLPLGRILPLQAYVCLGAHRKSRLSEVQLNYVHAQGLLAHGFDTQHLPEASTLLDLPAGRMVPAKATRVSAEKLDVMASSYHVADQVYTTITVVQYPAFGTQFEKRVGQSRRLNTTVTTLDPGSSSFVPPIQTVYPKAEREPRPEDEEYEPLYKEMRDEQGDSVILVKKIQDKREWKKDFWKYSLRDGEHYFVDAVVTDDPYILPARFVLFELDNGNRYKRAQEKMDEIKDTFLQDFKTMWRNEHTFYWNLKNNKNTDENGNTLMNIWQQEWQEVIRHDIYSILNDEIGYNPDKEPAYFWFTEDQSQLKTVFPEFLRATADKYIEFSTRYHAKLMKSGKLDSRYHSKATLLAKKRQTLPAHQLSLPQARTSAKSPSAEPAIAKLQTRIDALETRLSQVKQEENTKHLLEQVLERLDTP